METTENSPARPSGVITSGVPVQFGVKVPGGDFPYMATKHPDGFEGKVLKVPPKVH